MAKKAKAKSKKAKAKKAKVKPQPKMPKAEVIGRIDISKLRLPGRIRNSALADKEDD